MAQWPEELRDAAIDTLNSTACNLSNLEAVILITRSGDGSILIYGGASDTTDKLSYIALCAIGQKYFMRRLLDAGKEQGGYA